MVCEIVEEMIPADPKKYTMKEAHCFLFIWQVTIRGSLG